MFKVNEDRCIGCGACVGTCPEVFDFGDSQAVVKKQPTEEEMNDAMLALEGCPTGAIEKEGK
jgi:ferredoxin